MNESSSTGLEVPEIASPPEHSVVHRGWVQVALSKEVRRNKVRTVRRFGNDIVIARLESGRVVAFDSTCPHLGAHLGDGDVVGECIRCPFHHWQFDDKGDVAHVPNAKRLPRRAKLNQYHLTELGGVIFMYQFAADAGADAVPPPLPEKVRSALSNTSGRVRSFRRATIPTTIAEVAENAADSAHFLPVHGKVFRNIEPMTHRLEGESILIEANANVKFRNMPTKVQLQFFDPYTSITTTQNPMSRGSYLMALVAPREDRELEFLLMSDNENKIPLFDRMMNLVFARGSVQAADADLPIWANKVRIDRPVLSDADGPIMQFRKWLKQFEATAP